MSQAQDLGSARYESARYRPGLELLARLPETGSALSGEEASDILGMRTVKGIGAAFSGTGMSLEGAGIRPDEAVGRRTVRGGLPWAAGPRLRQTRHVLERTRRYWIEGACEEVPLEEPRTGDMRPVPVLRALGSRGTAYRFHGSPAELAASLDGSLLDIPDDDIGSIGETFVRRIKPGRDGGRASGLRKLRGEREPGSRRARLRSALGRRNARQRAVSAAERVDRRSAPGARRIALVAAANQVGAVCAWRGRFPGRGHPGWREVGDGTRIRHVERVGAHDPDGLWSAPPLQTRLGCWYEVRIRAGGKSIVLREEGLRGDDARTATRSIARWRASDLSPATVPVGDVRIAGKQPRPLSPRRTGPMRCGRTRRSSPNGARSRSARRG